MKLKGLKSSAILDCDRLDGSVTVIQKSVSAVSGLGYTNSVDVTNSRDAT